MTNNHITSLQHPKVKEVVRLHERKHRDINKFILVEGTHPVEEALKAKLVCESYYLRDGEIALKNVSCQVTKVSHAVMSKMSTTDTPSTMLAVMRCPEKLPLHTLLQQPFTLCLGIAGVQDPGNLGTLIRSACAFNTTGFIFIGTHVDPYHPKVIRSSSGLVFSIPLIDCPDMEALRSQIKPEYNLEVWGADAYMGTSYRQVVYKDKTLILLGSEAHGLEEKVWKFAKPLHIPMKETIDSLNVGVAGSIILSEAYQQHI